MTPDLVAIRGVLAAWIVFVPLMLWARRHLKKEATNTRDYASLAGIALQGLGFAIVWSWRSGRRIPLMPESYLAQWTIAITAVVLAFGSVLLCIAAIRTLGKQWSLVAGVIDNHALITSGPYAIVRHPIYLALMGLMIATGIAFGAPLGIGAAVCVYVLGTVLRISVEERLLKAKLGESYQRYTQKVPAFLPLPWRLF
jgi:protein-S-isoprenylcysteine O-methyltransferase Ste14